MSIAIDRSADARVSEAPAIEDTALASVASGSGIAVIAPLCFGTTLEGLAAVNSQQSFLDAIGAGHELVVYDQRGSGRSAPLENDAAWEQRGSDLWAVADAAGIERAVLYGVFDAGFTIAHAAAQQPDRVLGLIFNLVPPAIGTSNPRDGLPDALARDWFGESALTQRLRVTSALQAIGLAIPDAEAFAAVWEQTPASATAGLRLLREADLRPLVRALPSRALIVEPQRRPLVSGWGESLARELPCAQLVQPARAGEMLGAIHGFLAIVDIDEGHYASRLAAEFSGAVGETEHAVTSLQRIIVPVIDTVSSERAVEMACRLGRPQQAEIELVHVVEVPLTRSLSDVDAPARAKGEKALQLGQAIASRHGMRSRARLLFERSATHGILRVAREEEVDLIVMAFGEKRRPDPSEFSPTMRDVLRNAPCEVLIDQSQRVRG